MWLVAWDESRKRASQINLYKEECSYKEFLALLRQNNIYEKEYDLFLKDNKCIAILNSIPLFLFEYYKKEFWEEVIGRKELN